MAGLVAERLSKHFGGLRALSEVSLAVERGEILGLIGPNGSGKTTLFNCLTGFLRPTAGRVLVEGVEVTGWRPHRIAKLGVGRTFQIPAPFAKATVRENLMVAAGADLAASEERADRLLAAFDLAELAGEPAESLDSGHLRLLEMARVLMRDPKVVLLDEPTSGVDPSLLDDLLAHIRGIRRDGRSVCIVAHDMRAIEGVTERVVVLDRGRVIAAGSFEEVRRDPAVVRAYLGTGG